MPKVSVIIPTYNRADLLPRAVRSVLDQTFQDFELIIVDDCSTDNTREVVEEWQARDARVRSIFLEKNSGAPAHPKNVAVESSTGEFVAFLDSDDEWMPEKLEKQLEVFRRDPLVGFVSCEPYIIDGEGKIVSREAIPDIPEEGVWPSLLWTNFMFSESSVVVPRSVIERVGPRDEDPQIWNAEDRENELRIAAAGYRFCVIHEPLFKYYVHTGNMTYTRMASNRFHYAMVDFKYIAFYKKYKMEWMVYRSLAWGYFKLGDKKTAKKYRKLAFLSRPYDMRLFAGYVFSNTGSVGEALLTRGVKVLHLANYLARRNRRWEKNMDPHLDRHD